MSETIKIDFELLSQMIDCVKREVKCVTQSIPAG